MQCGHSKAESKICAQKTRLHNHNNKKKLKNKMKSVKGSTFLKFGITVNKKLVVPCKVKIKNQSFNR